MTDRLLLRPRLFGAALLALLAALPACSSGTGEEGAPEANAEAGEAGEARESGEAGETGETAGAPGRVTLSEAAFATARIEVEAARTEGASAAGAGGLQVPGQVDFDPARVAVVSPRTAGRIERLAAVPGDRVGAGQTVALLSSREFLTAQSDLVQAARRADLLRGTEDERGARALVEAARRRLRLLGAGAGVISRLERGGEPAALLGVPAPFAGSILETLTPAGSAVEAGTPIFRIADLSTVLVAAEVPERALGSLQAGRGATVRLAAMPDQAFSGRVERLGDVVDPQSRTVKALVRVPNPRRTLRPGMFATVSLDVPGAADAAPAVGVLTIPESALVTDGEVRYVFVEVGPRSYERRAVETVPGAAGRVVVTSGVADGDRVVTRGAFTLKSELGKAAFGDED